MSVVRSLLLFALAALAEIGGAWMVWQGVREHRGLAWVGAGITALATPAFTIETYQHVLPGMQADAARVFQGLVQSASTGPTPSTG